MDTNIKYLNTPIRNDEEFSHFIAISRVAFDEERLDEKELVELESKYLIKHRNNILAILCQLISSITILALFCFLLYKPYISRLDLFYQILIIVVSVVVLLMMICSINAEISTFFDKIAQKKLLLDLEYLEKKELYTEFKENPHYGWLKSAWILTISEFRNDVAKYRCISYGHAKDDEELFYELLEHIGEYNSPKLMTPKQYMENARLRLILLRMDHKIYKDETLEIFQKIRKNAG